MKLFHVPLAFLMLSACQSDHSSEETNDIDNCANAVVYPNAQIAEQMVDSEFSGELNNYWGDDTTKLDFKHVFQDGRLVASYFYFENGEIQEKYTFKCHSLHGEIEFYYENGQLGKVIPFEYGRRNGVGILYDSLGNESSRVIFKNDSIVESSEITN